MLRDDCGLRPGARGAVLLPPHWLSAAVLLGAWSTGLTLALRLAATAGPPSAEPFDVVIAAASRIGSWLEEVPDGKHRFSVFAAEPPQGYRDLSAALETLPGPLPLVGLARPTDAASICAPPAASGETWPRSWPSAGPYARASAS